MAEAETHKATGNDLFKAGNFEDAVKAYTHAIELNPDNPVYYSNRAMAYLQVPALLWLCSAKQRCICSGPWVTAERAASDIMLVEQYGNVVQRGAHWRVVSGLPSWHPSSSAAHERMRF